MTTGLLAFCAAPLAATESRAAIERRVLSTLASGAGSAVAREAAALPRLRRPILPPRSSAGAELAAVVSELESALAGGDPASLVAAWEDFEAQDLVVRGEFARTAARLTQHGIGGEITARLEAARAAYLAVSDRLHGALGPLVKSYRDEPTGRTAAAQALAASAEEARSLLAGLPRWEAPFAPLGAAALPYRRGTLATRVPRATPAITPSYLDPAAADPGSAELSADGEAPLSKLILDKAGELGYDAVAVYEFVKNGIRTEFYAGAMKGAEGTLRSGAGNDVDQASLLVALLRASSVPARYVRGVLERPIESVAAELGLQNAAAVPDALARAGIAHRPVIRGGRVAAVEVEHVWVSAHVPYTNYRGAVVDFSGKLWVPLAPALKGVTRTPSTGVLRAMAYPTAEKILDYQSAVQATDLLSQIRQEVEGYLQSGPGGSWEDQLGSRENVAERLKFLPSSLPATIVAVTEEVSSLPATDLHRVVFRARRGSGESSPVILEATLPLSALAGHRVTWSYTPASVEDHRTVNAWGGLYAVPMYLVRLRPRLNVDGQPVAIGTDDPLEMGAVHRLELELVGPVGSYRSGQVVVAGSYHALALGAQATLRPIEPVDDLADSERLAARLLSQFAHTYAEGWDEGESVLGGLLDVEVLRPLPSVVIASNALRVKTVLGLPTSFEWLGVTLDAALRAAEPLAHGTDPTAARDWMRLSAAQGSALEGLTFARELQVDGISADKGLALARAPGGPGVVTLTSDNVATELPGLAHPAAVKAEVENWIRQGLTVEIPRAEIQRNAWRGSVWKVEEPATGAAGYFLAGGLAGGASTEPPANWILDFLAQAFGTPYSAEPNNDPQSVVVLQKIPAGDGQEGEVGAPFTTPLAVLARDVDGRPVAGAAVIFEITQGGGKLIDADGNEANPIFVTSNELGIAQVTLKAGEKTSESPVYTQRNAGDEWATQSLAMVIEAVATAGPRVIPISEPYSALAHPGPTHHMRDTLGGGGGGFGIAGQWSDTLIILAEDRFDNVVSNVPITFSVGAPQINCSPAPANFQNAVVFDFATCPIKLPLLGQCGSSSLTKTSTIRGVFVGVILGNSTSTTYPVDITAPGASSLSIPYQESRSCRSFPLVTSNSSYLSDERGNNVQGAKVGESYRRPVSLALRYEWPEYEVKVDTEGHCYIEYGPGRTWRPTTAQLDFTVGNGGRASGATYVGDHYETTITTGLTAGENTLDFRANEVLVEEPSVNRDTCVEGVTTRRTQISRGLSSVYGLDPKITAVVPDPVLLGDTGNTLQATKIQFRLDPPDYSAYYIEVALYEDGALRGRAVAANRSGSGEVPLPRGIHLDVEKDYELELVASRGTDVEAKGDRFELPLFQRIFTNVSGFVSLQRDVDLLNERVCQFGSNFKFTTTQEAEVTLKFKKISSTGTGGEPVTSGEEVLIDGETFPAGDHEHLILPEDLLPGDYLFELSGISAVDGHEDRIDGAAISEFRTQDSLPVGHAIYKGVDLFDGHLSVVRTDFSVPGRGRPLEFIRSYSSNEAKQLGALGVGWGHSLEAGLSITPCGEIIVSGPEGGGMRFVDDGAGGLRPLKGFHGTLVANAADGSFDFYSKDGTRSHYIPKRGSSWMLDYVEDTNGNRSVFTYDRTSFEPKLVSVTDPGGRKIELTWERKTFFLFSGEVITKIAGPAGLETTFTYDDYGNLTSAAREGGARIENYSYPDPATAEFDRRHELIAVTDGVSGAETLYTYEKGEVGVQGNVMVPSVFVKTLTEPEGGTTTFTYDTVALGSRPPELTTRFTDRRGGEWIYRLNKYGSPLSITDPNGSTVNTTWAADDVVMTSRTDGNGVTTTFTHDEHGNVLTESLPVTDVEGGSGTKTVRYDFFPPDSFSRPGIKDRIRRLTDRNGVVSELTYDGRGNLLTKAVPSLGWVESYSYDSLGNQRTLTNANGKTTTFTYDANGNPVLVADAVGGRSVTSWDSRSRPISQSDPAGKLTRFDYDTLDRRITVTHPDATTETVAYDDAARTVVSTDGLGRETRIDNDLEGRTVQITNALGDVKVMAYEGEGEKVVESRWFGGATPRADTTFAYDLGGRLTTRTEPLGRVTTYAYDDNGNVIRETLTGPGLSGPQVTEHRYDELDRRHTVRRLFEGGVVEDRQVFDGEGRVLVEIDALGERTIHTYDGLGRRLSTTDATGARSSFSYDAVGNLLQETDARNQTRSYAYDAVNRLTSQTDALDRQQIFEYDFANNLIRQIDARLHEITHTYDARDRRTSTSERVTLGLTPPGVVTTGFGYDAVGNLTEIRYPNSNVETRTYDDVDRLLTRSDLLGPLETRTYDPNGNVLTQASGNGAVTTRTFDELHRLVREELPENRVSVYTYDAAGNRLTQRDPRGFVSSYEYDRLNRLVRTNDPSAVGTSSSTTYDLASRILTETDRRGLVTRYERDAVGRVTRIVDPASVGTSRSYTYDRVGNRITETDRRGIVTSYSYDAENQVVATTRDGVTLAGFQYDPNGNVRFETDANGNIVGYEYDERNLKVAENRPLAGITRYGLDAMGDVREERDPENRIVRRSWDGRRRQLTETDGAGATTTFTYDANGNQKTVLQPEGGLWTRDYDSADRLVRVANPLGQATTYAYDGNNNQTLVTDPRNRTVTFEYDSRNRQTALQYPDGAREIRTYDENGNLASLVDAKGQTTTFTYDGLNRETRLDYGPATPTTGDDQLSRTKVYDANGNVTSVEDVYAGVTGTRTGTTTYDSFDRPTTVTDARGETISYAYDANGNRTRLTDSDGRVTTYGFDANNRLTTITVPSSGVTQYEYFRNGRLRRIAYPNSTEARHTYDLANRLVRIDNSRLAAVISSYQYAYDRNGNRTSQIEQNGGAAETTTYQFDTADRLLGVTYPDQSVVYTYDAAGNRLSEVTRDAGNTVVSDKAFTYDDRSRLTAVVDSVDPSRSATYGYDANGNQIERVRGPIDHDFLYDTLDQLTEVQQNGTLIGRYLYDHNGLRVRKLAGGQVLRYVYDDASVLLQTDDAGNTLARYEYGPDRLHSLLHATEGRQFYLFDGLRSIADLTKSDGTVQVRYQWDAWGNQRATSGSSFNLFGFTGHERDLETGLYYARARFYDPELSRFLSEDPAAGDPLNPPSLHRYLYAYQNPTVYTDPSGEIALIDNLIGGVVSVAVGYGVAKLTGEKYTWTDAAVDFGVGALSSGLSSIAKLQKLGKVAQVASKVAIEASVDVAGEAVRAELKGEEFDVYDAAITGLTSVAGQGAAAVLGEGAKRASGAIAERFGQKVAAAADDFPTGRAAGGADAPTPTRAGTPDGDVPSASKSQGAGDPPPPPATQTKTAGAITAEGPSGKIEAGSNPSVKTADADLPTARGPPSQADIRERVLRNIEASQQARAASRFPGDAASSAPGVRGTPEILPGGKYDVGDYDRLRKIADTGLDAHHVGQKAILGRFIAGYDPKTAPSILVPKEGHTMRGPRGIVSRVTTGFSNPRQVIARDIRELRRVYPDIPNSQLFKLIELNRQKYPILNIKPPRGGTP
ncbi:MAG: RHS repeat-associated core domain-containing protein [Thermoanaerobaculia bacterium]|nr:RHS repeat-associated core domain-containing protein [Thermoanaerobaculia bacterium]